MTTIEHSIKLEIILDDKHITCQKLLALPIEMRHSLLSQMVRDLLVPKLEPILEDLNKNGSYAILKVRK